MVLLQLTKKNVLTFITIFMLYSVAGSILEHIMYYLHPTKKKAMFNPIMEGFPMYGAALYIIIGVHNAIGKTLHPAIQFAIYTGIAVLVEYTVGINIGAGSGRNGVASDGYIKTWDYTNDKYNYKGVIKLSNALLFGVLAMIVTRIHPHIKSAVDKIWA